MPELPEVETIKRDLEKLIIGRRITGIKSNTAKMVKPSLKAVRENAVGEKITGVGRRAKLVQIFLDNGGCLVFHLKLTGRILIRKNSVRQDGWQRVVLSLSGEKELRFCDLRKFGWLTLAKNQKELEKLTKGLGPEPLDGLTLGIFREILAASRRSIKVLLMDQKKISGIGNIYANDALWLAGINPSKESNKLGNEEQNKLYKAIRTVLLAGVRHRGASDQYYLDALGHKGSYQDHFLVYGRKGEKCFNCDSLIVKIFLAGRGTYLCPSCQK